MVDRRDLLKTIASSASLAGIGTATASRTDRSESFREAIDRSLSFRRKVDDALSNGRATRKAPGESEMDFVTRRWSEYLEKEGYRTGHVRWRQSLDPDEGDVGTERINDVKTSGVDATLSLADSGGGDYYAELSFKLYFNFDSNCTNASFGEDPKDSIGFGWQDSCWNNKYDYTQEDGYLLNSKSSSRVSFEENACTTTEWGFNVDDEGIFNDSGIECYGDMEGYSSLHYGGTYLTSTSSNGDCSDTQDTTINAFYDHTYEGSYSSFSISGGYPYTIGVSYTTQSYVDHIKTTSESDGTTPLSLTKEDAT